MFVNAYREEGEPPTLHWAEGGFPEDAAETLCGVPRHGMVRDLRNRDLATCGDCVAARRERDGYKVVDGVLLNHLDRVAARDVCEKLHHPWSREQAEAYSRYVADVVQRYREDAARRTPEEIAEQRAAARAAHGPGVELVDFLTGERWTT